MPSIYFHMAEARMLVDRLHRAGTVYPFMKADKWAEYLTLGTILTDATPREGKYITHFWNPQDFKHVVIAPDLSRFETKYPAYMRDPVLTGYLLHLHLDYRYFTEFLPRFVRFTDSKGNTEQVLDMVTYAVTDQGLKMPVKQFFSNDYFYGDYLKLNPYFVRKYDLSFPEIDAHTLSHWPLEETTPDKYAAFRAKALADLESPCRKGQLKIFSQDAFEAFISETLEQFLADYFT